ncbi:MAG: phosphoribosylamine--glycine ligase [Treponema sp.]
MKVFIVGNGGREHALALKIKESPLVENIYMAQGNAGTLSIAENISIKVDDIEALSDFVIKKDIDLVVAGSELPLSLGLENSIREKSNEIGRKVHFFGPSKECALLEASKDFSKSMMKDLGIPTARYESFTDYDEACEYFSSFKDTPVIKVDGLASGKGVFLPKTIEEGKDILKSIMKEGLFGKAGSKVIIEERLEGEELSLMAFSDGKDIALLPVSKDHKRLNDGDLGPNTGGMGAFAPHPYYSKEQIADFSKITIEPIIKEMAKRGTPYKGVLYAGLMVGKNGVKVLEYNCRLGDPETQVLMELFEGDIVPTLIACSEGKLSQNMPRWKKAFAITVVMASKGYPDGKIVPTALKSEELEEAEGVKVIHAGTSEVDGVLYATGGRALCVTSCKKELIKAEKSVYERIKNITFQDVQYRKDIAK